MSRVHLVQMAEAATALSPGVPQHVKHLSDRVNEEARGIDHLADCNPSWC